MKKINRLIIWTILCSFLLILPSCRIKDKAANNEAKNINLFPASVFEDNQLKWGYINEKGDFIIKPSFISAEDFQSNGLAFAGDGSDIGIIDRNGNYITQERFSYISPFSEGIAIGDTESGFKAIDEKGQIVFEANSFIADFKDGMAYFSQKSTDERYLYGYIDKLGKIVIQPKYEEAGSFVNGKALVKLGENNYEIIDKSGKTLSSFNHYYTGYMGEGLIAFRGKSDDKAGYMDEDGRVMIPPSFDYVEAFQDGFAVVGLYEDFYTRYGLINSKGNYVIKPEYSEIRNIGEGMFAVGIPINNEWVDMGSKYAIANSSGEILTDFVYYGVRDFKDGLASVNNNSSTFFINNEGKRSSIIAAADGIGEFMLCGDVIKANIDNRLAYMNKKGDVIWKADNEYKITQGISVNEMKYRPNRNLLIYYPEISGLGDKNIQNELNRNLKGRYIFEEYDGINTEDELEYNYQSDFHIKFYYKNLLGIEMTGYSYPFGAAHGMPVKANSHIDLRTGKIYELKDLFKPESKYIERINSIIKNKIESSPDDYFPDAFQGVSEEQNFIISRDSLFIYFTPYEIASYAAGFPEFEIRYEDIMDIIDTDGELWKAFN